MARPLMQCGVGQLEELFAKSKADQRVLKQLEHELQYRQVPRAVALLVEVQAAMQRSTPVPAPAPAVEPPQPSLWDERPLPTVQPPASPALLPPAAPVAARPAVEPAITRFATPPAPEMPLEDAYKLLKATPSSTWESIEQTRRILVQASHPEKLRALPDSKRSQALTEASRVNAALATLSHARCTGR
jgi:hypothetical protein